MMGQRSQRSPPPLSYDRLRGTMHSNACFVVATGSVLLAGTLACTRAVPDARPTKEPTASSLTVAPPPAPAASAEPAPAGDVLDERFSTELKAVFDGYKAWGRVDDELRWAPFLCRMPEPGRPAMSVATGGGHARKLFSLFAKNRNAYVGERAPDAGPTSTVGQVVVKESYLPEVVNADAGPGSGRAVSMGLGDGDHFDPYITSNGTTYRASTLAGIYVMLRKEPSTAGTDGGWVYGTLRPSGEVTSAGRVASCMGCHTAKPARLFGRHAR